MEKQIVSIPRIVRNIPLLSLIMILLSCKGYDNIYENCEVQTFLDGEEVTCMIKDPTNNVWIGTWNGIYMFNGSIWRTFNLNNSDLVSNLISDLTYGRDGNITVIYSVTIKNHTVYNWLQWVSTIFKEGFQAPVSIINDRGRISTQLVGIGFLYGIEENPFLSVLATPVGLGVYRTGSDDFKLYNSANSDLPGDEIIKMREIDGQCLVLEVANQDINKICYVDLRTDPPRIKTYDWPCTSNIIVKVFLLDEYELKRLLENCAKSPDCVECNTMVGIDDKGGTWYNTKDGLVRQYFNEQSLFKTGIKVSGTFETVIYRDEEVWFQTGDKVYRMIVRNK